MDPLDLFAFIKVLKDIATSLSEFGKTFGADESPPSFNEFINAQSLELFSVLGEAHQALEAVRKRELELEQKIAKLEDWPETEARYELWEIMPAKFAHRLKLEFVKTEESFHYICSNCFRTRAKSILQRYRDDGRPKGRVYGIKCPRCKEEIIGRFSEISEAFDPGVSISHFQTALHLAFIWYTRVN